MPCAPTRAPVTCLHPFPEPSHIPTFSTRPQVRELRRLARDKERRGAVDKALGFNVQEEVVHRWGGWGGGLWVDVCVMHTGTDLCMWCVFNIYRMSSVRLCVR